MVPQTTSETRRNGADHSIRAQQSAGLRRESEAHLTTALALLESRWGSAAVKLGVASNVPNALGRETASDVRNALGRGSHASRAAAPQASAEETDGALALALSAQPASEPESRTALPDEIVPTGFGRLDALLGTGGLPRGVSASFRGARSSGKTALALHCLAQAQARGGIVAFLDLCRVFDPLEAVARGVDLRWLLVIRPADIGEGWALGAALVSGRQVDLLVVDLPARLPAKHEASLRRLAAHARRSAVRMIVLEPTTLSAPVHGALAESVGLRLELEQRSWLRAGRDIVGRRVSVNIAKNRFGPPGRETEIEIRYLTDGENAAAAERYATAAQESPPTSRMATLIQPLERRRGAERLDLPPRSHLANEMTSVRRREAPLEVAELA